MKRSIALLLAVLLLAGTAGCGRKGAEASSAEAPSAEAPAAEAPATEAAAEAEQETAPTYPVKEFERFYLEYEGVALIPGETYSESLFQTTAEPETIPDCRTEGYTTTYSYNGLTLQTAILNDQEMGVRSDPFINSLEIKADNVVTPEGVSSGSTVESLLEAYGSGYTEQFGAYVYTAGECCLYAYPDETGETIQYLVIALSEEALAKRLSDFLAANEEPPEEAMVLEYEDGDNYAGIRFEGLESRYFRNIRAYISGRDGIADNVHAYDEHGNELPVEHTLHFGSLIKTCQWGPGIVKLTATDAEGHTATQWMSFFIESYGEKDRKIIAELAENAGDDLQEIKNYVRSSFRYTGHYAGRNIISATYKNGSGNCYSFARVLQSVLEYKGYHAIVVWSAGAKHNWVMVETEDGWRHLDATTGPRFPETEGLQTDEERAATHANRPWSTRVFPPAV